MSREPRPTDPKREKVVLCGVQFPDHPAEFEGELSEIRALVKAADADPLGIGTLQRRRTPDPATLMGKGKVGEVSEEVEAHSPDAVVIDNDLTPAQGRNLEKAWSKRVIDRSELILDIFAARAQTRQARLQVELAQNEYLAPRLRRMWTHLERTEGAIGTRGPGETQLETDRRLLRKRISDLKKELSTIEARKQRQVRSRQDQFTVGLVGYTNAGKSTLLNLLTGADEFVADMPFATLDTRTRRWPLPDGRKVLLSDTVGFLQRLPHHLVASFHATLEETLNADLLIHVVDASHPDAGHHMTAVDEVLESLGGHLMPAVIVFNKIDKVEDPLSLHLLMEGRDSLMAPLSARTGDGLDRLVEIVAGELDRRTSKIAVRLPIADGKSRARVNEIAVVLEEDFSSGTDVHIVAKVLDAALGNLRRQVSSEAVIEVLEAAELRA